MNENIIVVHYAVYMLISAVLIVWVGKTLFKNGRVFLIDSFNHNEPMVDSVNHLIIVGFYLINFGIVALFLKVGIKPHSIVDSIELMSTKIGIVLLLLVAMHFLNVFSFAKVRNKSLKRRDLEARPLPIPDNSKQSTGLHNAEAETPFQGSNLVDRLDGDEAPTLQPVANGMLR
jgi:hypothetical protein